MKEDCSLCGVTFQSDVPAHICPDCEEEEKADAPEEWLEKDLVDTFMGSEDTE